MEVADQGVPQIAGAHHNDAMAAVHTQDMTDLTAQLADVVAVALLSELAEAAQILPDLGGGDAHLLPQGAGGNTNHALGVEII